MEKTEISVTSSDISEPIQNVEQDKHPLETNWTFYFDHKLPKSQAGAKQDYSNYEKNLINLGMCDTVEGFWRLFSLLTEPDILPPGHDFYMFRESFLPAWETFPQGGCWIIKVRKHNGLINRLWEELLFSCIGEMFDEPDVVGVALSTRQREDLLSVWNRDNATKPNIKLSIGDKLKSLLNLDKDTIVEYKEFKTALTDGSTFRNARPYVYAASLPANDPRALGQNQQK